jgi:DNA-binding NarL/FixJ family response regulator
MARARRPVSGGSRSGALSDAHSVLRVVIVAEHALVGESVLAALTARGYAAGVVRVGARPPAEPPDVGILLTYSADDRSLRARAILERMTIPWLVLAPDERGPSWGSYYASGATLVVPPSASLDEVCRLLQDLALGRGPSVPRGRDELISAWHQTLRERDELNDRLKSLTAREHQVLEELHDGVGVQRIAEGSEVAEATVRTQVKAILRKLDVSSQIAAVAAYTKVRSDPAEQRRTDSSPSATHQFN